MSETLNVNQIVFPVTADAATGSLGWQGNAVTGHVYKAPSAAHGGAITITSAYFVNAAETDAGTAFALQLENWGTAGTAIKSGAAGTIAAALGGTADTFAAGTPKAFTISNAKVAADEWIVLRKTETNSSDPTRGLLVISYLHGV